MGKNEHNNVCYLPASREPSPFNPKRKQCCCYFARSNTNSNIIIGNTVRVTQQLQMKLTKEKTDMNDETKERPHLGNFFTTHVTVTLFGRKLDIRA